ncbi:MAG: hypothetical protein K6B51_05605 [Bacilli bacterium]|nr:hypothetical protein [Bacilli bacterium]
MKKLRLLLTAVPLLVASCNSIPQGQNSSKPAPQLTSSSFASHSFGNEPLSAYSTEEKRLLEAPQGADTITIKYLVDAGRCDPHLIVNLHDTEAWADVETVSKSGVIAAVYGPSTGRLVGAYDSWDGSEPLIGKSFRGMPGGLGFSVMIPEEACRNPSEAFFKVIFVAQEDTSVITGCALAVAYPYGEAIEAKDPTAPIVMPEVNDRVAGPVWLNWKIEAVCEGISFPTIDGKTQQIDRARVEAALDIMVDNAKGSYFDIK